MPLHLPNRIRHALRLAAFLGAATFSPACGPELPTSYLATNGNATWTYIDFGYSLLEIAKSQNISIDIDTSFKPSSLSTAEADTLDFLARLSEPDMRRRYNDAQRATLLAEYKELRSKDRLVTPEELSRPGLQEFYLYHKGTETNHDGLIFPPTWFDLLKLPPDQRRYRTTWALYMMGVLAEGVDREVESAELFRQVRVAARQGFRDRQGLAHASYRAECRYRRYNINHAPKWAWVMKSLGDQEGYREVVFGMQLVIDRMKLTPATIREIYSEPVAREVLFAYLASRPPGSDEGPDVVVDTVWKTLRELKPVPTRSADRAAYAAFTLGDQAVVEKWLKWADPKSLLTLWVQAEIARSKGDYTAAATRYRAWIDRYAELVSDRPAEPDAREWLHHSRLGYNAIRIPNTLAVPNAIDWESYSMRDAHRDVHARLGTVLVHKRDFLQALDAFVRAGAWIDAAFVAEELVPVAMLRQYVDANRTPAVDEAFRKIFILDSLLPEAERWNVPDGFFDGIDIMRYYDKKITTPPGDACHALLRYLLGRRLLREGEVGAASGYLPERFQSLVERLRRNEDLANDTRAGKLERSLALFDTARILRWHGLELTGTEGLPDSAVTCGNFFYGAIPNPAFRKLLPQRSLWDARNDDHAIFGSGPELLADYEHKRADPVITLKSLTQNPPALRFHYRYRAARLMLQAAELSPDDSLKAAALYCAANWIASLHQNLEKEILDKLVVLPAQLPLVAEIRRFPAARRPLTPEFVRIVKSDETRLESPAQLPIFYFPPETPPATTPAPTGASS
jgi:hypothetical protein